MKKSTSLLTGTMLAIGLIGNANASLTGLLICNQLKESFTISCNGKTAPPILAGTCLPITWKEIATIPEIFGGTPQNPMTHLTCQWTTKSGTQAASTVMDIEDDHSGNFPMGKISNIVINDDYTYTSIPSPIPQGYTPDIAVFFQHK